jgi:hypothetical protein
MRTSDQKIRNVGTIKLRGQYNPIPEAEIKAAFRQPGVINRATRLPLAELADKYAGHIEVLEVSSEKVVGEVAAEFLDFIVARCLMTEEMFTQLSVPDRVPNTPEGFHAFGFNLPQSQVEPGTILPHGIIFTSKTQENQYVTPVRTQSTSSS